MSVVTNSAYSETNVVFQDIKATISTFNFYYMKCMYFKSEYLNMNMSFVLTTMFFKNQHLNSANVDDSNIFLFAISFRLRTQGLYQSIALCFALSVQQCPLMYSLETVLARQILIFQSVFCPGVSILQMMLGCFVRALSIHVHFFLRIWRFTGDLLLIQALHILQSIWLEYPQVFVAEDLQSVQNNSYTPA